MRNQIKQDREQVTQQADMMKQMADQIKQQGDQIKQQGDQMKQQGDQMKQQADQMKQQGDQMKQQGDQMKQQGDQIKQQGDQIKQQGDQIKQQGDQMRDQMKQQGDVMTYQVKQLETPVNIIMADFEKHKRSNGQWFSAPFYTHLGGYMMCLKVNANGCGRGEGTHVTVAVCLMRGEFDYLLKWPFRGDVTIQLKKNDPPHYQRILPLNEKIPNDHVVCKPTKERNTGRGYTQYLSHADLYAGGYLKDDKLVFCVSVMFGVCKSMFFLVVSQLLYVRMHRTKTKKTTNNIGIGASGVAAIISAFYIVDLQYMWSKEHDRYEHEARCICLLGVSIGTLCQYSSTNGLR